MQKRFVLRTSINAEFIIVNRLFNQDQSEVIFHELYNQIEMRVQCGIVVIRRKTLFCMNRYGGIIYQDLNCELLNK